MVSSVRARATLGAIVVVAVALLVGAFAFVAILTASLHDSTARAAETRTDELATRVEAEGPESVRDIDDEIVQVVDSAGSVIATSEDAPSTPLPLSDSARATTVNGEAVLVMSDELDDGSTVRVAVTVEDDAETISTVTSLLLVAVPVLVLLVGATTWVVVGRSFAPVTRMRSEVDDITADRLDRRLPVPESRDEIAALAVTMNGMLARLDGSAQAQRRFVSDASHELRSPLATIRQHVELSQAHPETTSLEELADIVKVEGLRLQGLVDSLLLLARLDEGGPTSHEPVDLDDLALLEASRLRSSGLTVDASRIGGAQVVGDPRLLGQLVRNLADNAARHARSQVAIGVEERNGQAVLTIDDDGAGIPASERDRVFERFVRLDEARSRDAGGSGLGLPIVRAIADAAGGTVAISDSPWGGARFSATFPVAS